MRKIKFQYDYYYHIYNRGVDKRNIFIDKKDYIRFIYNLNILNNTLTKPERKDFFTQNVKNSPALSAASALRANMFSTIKELKEAPKLIDISCYCLIPNHFHLLLKQLTENGISQFMHKLANAHTHCFNIKHNRAGSLFEGTFKASEIKKESRLWQISCYINGNPEIHGISKAKNWQWSSYRDYLNLRNGTLCNKNIILNQFENTDEYKKLTKNIIKESKERKQELKNYILE